MDAAAVLGAHCRFEPSCSDYAIEALRRHGALARHRPRRLARAALQPLDRGGYDPVPRLRLPLPPESDGTLMDQNRLFLAIAISVAILLGFQFLLPHQPAPQPAAQQATKTTPSHAPTPAPVRHDPAFPGTQPVAVAAAARPQTRRAPAADRRRRRCRAA